MKDIDTMIVDGSSMAFRAGNVLFLSTKSGEETSVAFGMVKMIRALLEKYHPKEIVICWDYHGSASKKSLFPDYKKKDRKEETLQLYIEVKKQIDEMYNVLPALGLKQVRIEGIEADDLIGILARHLGRFKQVMVVSSDHDLWQLVNFEGIVVYHPQKDLVLEQSNFEEKVGFKPEMWVWFRSLTGETGDNIPGLKWFGEKTAKELLTSFGPWSSWWDDEGRFAKAGVLDLLNKRQKESLLAKSAFETLSISYALTKVGMLDEGRSSEVIECYEKQIPTIDEEVVKAWFFIKEFNSMLARFHGWLHPFRRLVQKGGE